MLTKTKLVLAAALLAGSSVAFVGGAAAATHHGRAPASAYDTVPQYSRPSALTPSFAPQSSGRFSGPFRTDSAPITGGGY